MADVRALLKAKRQEARITHPLASYDRNGQLKCVVCGTLVKHASAWEGHLGSKIHRTNIARLKEEEKIREEQALKDEKQQQQQQGEQTGRGKRKAGEQDSESESDEGDIKRRKVGEAPPAVSSGFPADFFSDRSRAPLPPPSDEEEDDEESEKPQPQQPKTAIDLEYERFQRELLNGPDFREAYERATVAVEPELVSETMDGIPSQDTPSDVPQKMNEENSRRQKEQEEKELIMDRLMDEERAQEEADMKVSLMKSRFEALKKKREAGKTSKANARS